MSASSTVHDGGGTQVLTSVQSGQTYTNYLVRSTLNVGGTTGVTIENCDIGGFSGNGITTGGGATNLSIINNTLHDISATGIYGISDAQYVNCHFDNNTFTNVFEGVHLFLSNNPGSHDVSVSNNHLTGVGRWGIEIQSVSTGGLKVLNNYVAIDPNQAAPGGCLSIATGDGQNAGVPAHPRPAATRSPTTSASEAHTPLDAARLKTMDRARTSTTIL